MRRFLADWLNHKGNQAAGSGNRNRAIEFYKQSAKADPTWSTPHFNLSLQAKFAATALRDWPQARQAWRNAGIDVPQGEGEWTWASPATACTRINPAADGEVVWGQRINPAPQSNAKIT